MADHSVAIYRIRQCHLYSSLTYRISLWPLFFASINAKAKWSRVIVITMADEQLCSFDVLRACSGHLCSLETDKNHTMCYAVCPHVSCLPTASLQSTKFPKCVPLSTVSLAHSYIQQINHDLREVFRSGLTRPIEWRRNQLYQLVKFLKENSDALAECLRLDLGRPKQEAIMGDLGPSLERILITASKLEEWTKPTEPIVSPWQQSWKPRVEKHPKGVVLIVV
jgi:hypothetical protein